MTINTIDGIGNGLLNNASRIIIDKASIANAAAGQFHSLWRATGQPGQGAIPTAAATCDDTTVGCLGFAQQTAPSTSYLAQLEGVSSNNLTTVEIHDRLMHMGGLNGTLATAQPVNLDLNANLGNVNLNDRKGDANFSDVQWWAEFYADTGATGVNLTVGVTYNDGTTGNLTAVALAATRRASFMIPLNGLIPAAASGKFIRDIDTATLSATTGAAGNFGFTCTRYRGMLSLPLANFKPEPTDWTKLGTEIFNDSCLFPIMLCSTTSTGTLRATGRIIHG